MLAGDQIGDAVGIKVPRIGIDELGLAGFQGATFEVIDDGLLAIVVVGGVLGFENADNGGATIISIGHRSSYSSLN